MSGSTASYHLTQLSEVAHFHRSPRSALWSTSACDVWASDEGCAGSPHWRDRLSRRLPAGPSSQEPCGQDGLLPGTSKGRSRRLPTRPVIPAKSKPGQLPRRRRQGRLFCVRPLGSVDRESRALRSDGRESHHVHSRESCLHPIPPRALLIHPHRTHGMSTLTSISTPFAPTCEARRLSCSSAFSPKNPGISSSRQASLYIFWPSVSPPRLSTDSGPGCRCLEGQGCCPRAHRAGRERSAHGLWPEQVGRRVHVPKRLSAHSPPSWSSSHRSARRRRSHWRLE